MRAESLIAALDLPAGSRVDRRVPKKLLLENGAPTSADKRYINEGIDELLWLAALKPTTVGVPEYRNDVREYLEIAVLQLSLRPGAKQMRLVELVHRAIPYPVLLFTDQEGQTVLSCAHIRWAQNEANKTVLDGEVVSVSFDINHTIDHEVAFCESLALGQQPRSTLYTLYQGWMDALLALQSARITGKLTMPQNHQHATARHDALNDYVRLEAEVAHLRTLAAKEKQLNRQVDLNLKINRLQSELNEITKKL